MKEETHSPVLTLNHSFQHITDQETFENVLQLDKVIFYLQADWSGPERLSRGKVLDLLQATGIPVYVIDCSEEATFLTEWLHDRTRFAGWGETLLISNGELIDYIPNTTELEQKQIEDVIRLWRGYTLDLTYDFERFTKLYEKYFAFEKTRGMKSFPFRATFIVSVILIFIGVFFDIVFWLGLGVTVLVITAGMRAIYQIRFSAFSKNFIRVLQERNKKEYANYSYQFDMTGMTYKSKDVLQKVSWNMMRCYEENDGDIYLFIKGEEVVYDIISESIMGREIYDQFKRLLIRLKLPKI